MEDDIKDIINKNDLVIWSLKYCHYSKSAKELSPVMNAKKEKMFIFDVDCYGGDSLNGNPLNKALNLFLQKYFSTEHKTYPKIFYKGNFVGGYTQFHVMVMNNRLSKCTRKKLR